ARVGLFDKPDDLLGAESALLHVRPLGFTDFIASAGTAQWGQVNYMLLVRAESDRSHEGWLCGQSATCFVKQRLLAGQGGTVSNEVGNSAAH
ncbi:hypothetical protein, partial [Xanthomonas perforans]|uniref:hypothetical protein n=1 Tax=Xanthomonas perforans TaxID=442694 RepID=UPI0019D266F7